MPRANVSEITQDMVDHALAELSDAVANELDRVGAGALTMDGAFSAVYEALRGAVVATRPSALRRRLGRTAVACILGIASIDAGVKR